MPQMFEIISVPVLSDNYIHLIINKSTASVVAVDPGVAKPLIDFIKSKNFHLSDIFLTHHHGDHIGGVHDLKQNFPHVNIYGHVLDRHRLPDLTHPVNEGSQIHVHGIDFEVWHLPGHTSGHIAYISKSHHLAFTGDVLFGMGCGRVFEGTYEEMFATLSRLKKLDPGTRIFCTHEYTVNNGKFAVTQFPQNHEISAHLSQCVKQRESGEFTVPLLLETELRTNPFLLANNLEEFSRLRDARNHW